MDVLDFSFLLSLRFAKMLFYHTHLPRCEVAVALLVAHAYQGIMQTLGVPYFLSEESQGRYIAQVGVLAFTPRQRRRACPSDSVSSVLQRMGIRV